MCISYIIESELTMGILMGRRKYKRNRYLKELNENSSIKMWVIFLLLRIILVQYVREFNQL